MCVVVPARVSVCGNCVCVYDNVCPWTGVGVLVCAVVVVVVVSVCVCVCVRVCVQCAVCA